MFRLLIEMLSIFLTINTCYLIIVSYLWDIERTCEEFIIANKYWNAMVPELTLKRPKIHDIPSKGIKIKAALIQDLKRKIYMIIQEASDTFHNQPFKNAVKS